MKQQVSQNPNRPSGYTVFLAVFEFIDGNGTYSNQGVSDALNPGDEVTYRIKLAPLSPKGKEKALADVFACIAGVLGSTPSEVQRDAQMQDYLNDEFITFQGQVVRITAEKKN